MAIAISVEGGDDLSYGAWDARSNAVARGLAARGVRAGDRVALLFDARRWADFAVAHRGVLSAGGVAVLLSPGAARAELVRALSHSQAIGLLCAPHRVPPGVGVWAAHPDEVGAGHDPAPVVVDFDAAGLAEVIYPSTPLGLMQPRSRHRADAAPSLDGWLVHAWAPGSPASGHALGMLGGDAAAATVAGFDADELCALAGRVSASALGLTPALAAALLASGAPSRHDLSSVRRIFIAGTPRPALRAGLSDAFPAAAQVELDRERAAPPCEGTAPVAVSQEGMLWHEQFTPGSFNLPCLVRRYQGPLDVAAMEWALSELVRRHQPLRSTFALIDGEPRQIVGEYRPRLLRVHDLGTLAPDERDEEVSHIVAEATGAPFDLVAGPLFEPRLLRLGPDDHVLVVRLHHTVFDDWSVDLFRREVSALYAARLAGTPSPLMELDVSFADFCRRQRARLEGAHGAEERLWWRRELAGAPLAVQLRIGPARPDDREPVRVDLPPSLVDGLRALGPRLRATPFMTVLAAFSVLLARTTGRTDLVIATVVAHRNQTDVEPLVGCFTKKVPLRLRVGRDASFSELVAASRASLLGALSHQGLAFDAAVQEGLGPAAAAHGVVAQLAVVFQGETPQRVKLALPGLVAGPYPVRPGVRAERHFSSGPEQDGPAQAPEWGDGIYLGTFLVLSLLDTPDGMALVARGVFHRPQVRRLLEDFQRLLGDVVVDPEQGVSALVGTGPLVDEDVVDVRGFRARRSRLETALAGCPGVSKVGVAVREVDGEPRLVADVVVEGGSPPTLRQLRQALWSSLPGAPWPAAMSIDGAGAPADPPGADRLAVQLAAMWAESSGKPVEPHSSYWQDFSFLPVLAEARAAGLALADEHVVRCRTPEMLAAAVTAAQS